MPYPKLGIIQSSLDGPSRLSEPDGYKDRVKKCVLGKPRIEKQNEMQESRGKRHMREFQITYTLQLNTVVTFIQSS